VTRRQADVGLVLLTIVWGTTFTVVHQSVQAYPVFCFLALRFGVATIAFLPATWRRRHELSGSLRAGIVLGVLLFGGFAAQTLGLQRTTPARAGFITGLSVVLVPMFGRLFGQRPARRAVVGAVLALAGLGLVSFGCRLPILGCASSEAAAGAGRLIGDLWVLACAFIYTFHIIGISHWTSRLSPLCLNGVQMAVVALLSGAFALGLERPLPAPSIGVTVAALFLGVVATALVLALWLLLQPHTTATHAALIFALEPVFAAFFSWLWLGEPITAAIWSGGALMFGGVILAELPLGQRLEAVPFLKWLSDDPMAH
jgi:drug/metabolite transporter (DMT)-like permease